MLLSNQGSLQYIVTCYYRIYNKILNSDWFSEGLFVI